MAIQFHCAACRQPIEVDDEWATQSVACPFCHRVVTAPSISTIDERDFDEPPVARRLPNAPARATRMQTKAPLAKLGFIFCLTAVFFLVLMTILMNYLIHKHVGAEASPQEVQTKLQTLVQQQQEIPAFLGILSSMFFGISSWIAGITLSIISLSRREPRRGLAVISLWAASVLPFLMCL